MNIQEIITKKRDHNKLTREEICFFVKEYVKDNITDYQAAALVMAMYLNGMDEEETKNLTIEMAESGEILDLSEIGKTVVDKHSTGGVGDKITIILTPIIASLGIPVAKMSGRGLGFTGGTIDKLESIPGYNTSLSMEKFIESVKNIGISLIGQTANLAPADKKLYALRDSIACVDSIPLISSSIMSKKIAAGADKIVLDVTVGSGAFMQTKEDAVKISKMMKSIGQLAGKETICVLTNMDEPVGHAVGNTLEIIEAVNCLKGNIPEDIKEIILTIGSYIIKLAGEGENLEENREKILENIGNKKAYAKFLELVKNQGGQVEYIENLDLFEKAKITIPIHAKQAGYIHKLDAKKIGEASVKLGAGRIKKEDSIDYSVGFYLEKKIGDKVEIGDILAYVYANDEDNANSVIEDVQDAYIINEENIEKPDVIIDII